MLKTLLATASLSLAVLVLPIGTYGPVTTFGGIGLSEALAHSPKAKRSRIDVEVDFDVGDDGYDDDDYDDEDYDDEHYDRPRISCYRGKRIVRRAGFHRVRPRSCSGRIYRYIGRKHGDRFIIGVHSRRARIVFVREID